MKAVLISIKPKWCEMIASGKKTIEVRKTMPKIETPFKCYIYCTNPNTKNPNEVLEIYGADGKITRANGKVISEFFCDEIEEFAADYRMDTEQTERIADLACIKMSELMEYGYYSDCLFAWHISDLKIYDKPKELLDFYVWKKCNSCRDTGYESTACCYDEDCKVPAMITKPPQSWCYVESIQEAEE